MNESSFKLIDFSSSEDFINKHLELFKSIKQFEQKIINGEKEMGLKSQKSLKEEPFASGSLYPTPNNIIETGQTISSEILRRVDKIEQQLSECNTFLANYIYSIIGMNAVTTPETPDNRKESTQDVFVVNMNRYLNAIEKQVNHFYDNLKSIEKF